MIPRPTVFSKGIKRAIREWSKANNMPLCRMDGVVMRNVQTDSTNIDMFNKIIKFIPEPWMENYCNLTDAPRCKVTEEHDLEDFSTEWKNVPTPHLDAFNGVEGGWC